MTPQGMWRRRAAIIVWLFWMVVMFQFSTQLWNSAHTKAILETLLSVPGLPEMTGALDHLNVGVRKAAHLTEYIVLTVVGYGAVVVGFKQTGARSLQIALACAILFAISDEWHQRFVVSRTSTPQDVFIDVTGACIAVAGIALWRWQTKDRESSQI